MSKLSEDTIKQLRLIFPEALIKTEECVYYENQKLFLDIFMPQFGLVIEVHGRQHDEYVDHFHGSEKGFREYRRRDRFKEAWVEENGYVLVVLREKHFPLTAETLLELIDDASST